MAGQVSQSESNIIYKRLANVANNLLGIREEVERLASAATSLDLAANLDNSSNGTLTKAQAIAVFVELNKYKDWFDNKAVASTGAEASPDRRAAIDPFILAEPLL